MANKHIDLILNSTNQITGAAVVGASSTKKESSGNESAGAVALPGQTVHRVEIPEELIGHPDFHRIVSQLLHIEDGVAKVKSLTKK
jgi:hypothetical protein